MSNAGLTFVGQTPNSTMLIAATYMLLRLA